MASASWYFAGKVQLDSHLPVLLLSNHGSEACNDFVAEVRYLGQAELGVEEDMLEGNVSEVCILCNLVDGTGLTKAMHTCRSLFTIFAWR
jgi:hypothetical protein